MSEAGKVYQVQYPATVSGKVYNVKDVSGDSSVSGKVYQVANISGGGGGSATKYGVSIDNLLGDVDANGALLRPTDGYVLNLSGVKDLAFRAIQYRFYQDTELTGVIAQDLTTVTGSMALSYAFSGSSVESADFRNLQSLNSGSAAENAFAYCNDLSYVLINKLVRIAGDFAAGYIFSNCSALKTIDIVALAYITGSSACQSMFANSGLEHMPFTGLISVDGDQALADALSSTAITTARFDNLTTISGSQAMRRTFRNCTGLISAYFPSLVTINNTDAFGNSASYYVFYNCKALTEIHFRADMQATIEALTGYSAKFGATNATIYFDL